MTAPQPPSKPVAPPRAQPSASADEPQPVAAPPAEPAGHADPPRTPRSVRSRRLDDLASEGGLLLLSLMLAVMIWAIVRELVADTETLLVKVNPIVPAGYQAVVQGEVELRFKGPRGKVEEAVARIRERGRSVKLQVAPFPPTSQATERDFDARDEYLLPFRADLLEGLPRPPTGRVVRLVQGRFVRIAVPEPAGLPPDRRVRITLEPDHLLLDAAAGTLPDELPPDRIDVKPLLDRPGQPHRVPLTFEAWRTGADDKSIPPEILQRRAAVPLRPVTAVVQVEVVAEQALANTVHILVHNDWAVTEISEPAEDGKGSFTGNLLASEANPRLERATFTGRIRSTNEALEDLEEHRDDWRWVLYVGNEDLPEPGKPAKEVQARLRFVALADRFHELELRGSLQFTPFNVPVKVVSTKR